MIELLLSLLGPVYFGYQHDPYAAVVIWALITSALFFWRSRDALQRSRKHAYGTEKAPATSMIFITALIFISIAVVFLGVHSALYFLVARFV